MADEIIGNWTVDVKDFRDVAKALRKAEPAMRLELLRNLKVAGNLVAKDAKTISSQYSESIPPTIKTRVRGVGVSVEAGGRTGSSKSEGRRLFEASYGTSESNRSYKKLEEGVVIAGLYELGNRGGSKSAASTSRGVFRHPVWGSDVWVDQPRHPFLVPAGKKNEAKVLELVFEALDEITRIIVLAD